MIWMLKLLGIGKAILGWAQTAFKWALSDWRHALIAVLVAVGAYFYLSASTWQGRAERALATVERRNNAIALMSAASEAAKTAQLALNKTIFDKQTQIARLTDENETNRLKLAARASNYADRMRFDKICGSETSATAESGITESSDRPDPDAVLLSRADFDLLNSNTARLMDVKAWGDRMIAEGLAVKVE